MLITLLIPIGLIVLGFARPDRRDARTLKIAGSVLLPLAVIVVVLGRVSSGGFDETSNKEIEVKANLHTLQIAVDRYGFDHQGHYPRQIQDLVTEKYILAFPENPFDKQPMRSVRIGDPDFEGNFTYEPVIVSGEVTGYNLYVYGSRRTAGQDINSDGIPDHVILVLQNPTGEQKYVP
jgi:hypothetical protein